MSTISRREFLRLSTVAAAGAIVVACTKTTEAPKETPKAAEATATPKAAVEATATPKAEAPKPWPRGEVPRNRTLIRSFNGPEYTNTTQASCYTGYTHQESHASQYEALYYYAALADKTYNYLCESHEYNADATELTMHLRKGVEWSDGQPFTAKDTAFLYNTLRDKAPDYSNSADVKAAVKEAIAVDDYTVKFILNESNYRFHFFLCTTRFDRGVYTVPEHIYKDIEDWRTYGDFDVAKGLPVVTGAYQCVELTPSYHKFDLRYDWWAAKTGFMKMPEVERILNIGGTDDTAAAQRIINNEIDEPLDMRPRVIKTVLDQAPHVITHTGREKPYGYVDWWPISMFFNCTEEPYSNVKFRWAVAYCVDQQQLVDVGWDGAGQTTNGPFPYYPGLVKYIDTIKDILEKYNPLEVNLDKAAQLMTELGFEKDNEGFWAKDGTRPDMDIWAGVPLFGDIAPITAEQLRKGGFYANHVTPPDVWDGKSDGRAKLHFFGHGGSVKDPYDTIAMYQSKWVTPTGQNCGNNRPRWGNPEFDALVEEFGRTPEGDAKTFDLFHKAMEIWYRELPEVPLVQWFHRMPMNTTYWSNWPVKENPYNTALWHLTMPITLWNLKATNA